jgi:hypothetical protein
MPSDTPPGFGLRQSSGAFAKALLPHWLCAGLKKPHSVS